MKGRGKFYLCLKGNKGSSIVVIVCATMLIILASALLTDVGYAAIERFKLNRNAEAVAVEGAEILVNSRDKAVEYMKLSAVRKVGDLNALDIRVSDNNKEITVSMGKPFRYIFLSLLGFGRKDISSDVTVKLSCVNSYKGSRPFAVVKQDFKFGERITLTLTDVPAQNTDFMEFFPVSSGTGSFKTDIIYGNRKSLRVGDKINVLKRISMNDIKEGIGSLIKKCKHEPVCTYDNYVMDCSRIVIVLVIDKEGSLDGGTATISGFAAFFIENYSIEGNHANITGRFIKYTVKENTSDGVADFGLLGVRMIR